MRTTGKGQMPIGFAPDTEFRRFLKDFRVAVGRSDAKMQVGPRGNLHPADRDGGRGLAVAELVGRTEAQHLFDTGADQRGFRQQSRLLIRVVMEQREGTADQVGGRLMACVENKNAVLNQLDLGQLPAVISGNEPRQHVGFRIPRISPAPGDEVLQIGFERAHRSMARLQLRFAQGRLQRAENCQRPVPKGAAFFHRDVQQVADDLHRNATGIVLNQVRRGAQPFQQTVNRVDQPRLHPCQRLGRQGRCHDPPHAGVQRWVIEHEACGVMLKQRAARAEFRREGQLFVRDIKRGVAVNRVQVRVAADQHRAIGLAQHRGLAQQAVVMGEWVFDKPLRRCGQIKHRPQ